MKLYVGRHWGKIYIKAEGTLQVGRAELIDAVIDLTDDEARALIKQLEEQLT